MSGRAPRRVLCLGLLAAAGALGCPGDGPSGARRGARPPAAVEVALVARGPIAQVRTLSGALETPARLEVSTKIEGRVERLAVDLGDEVREGQLLAALEDEELVQLHAQAKAELEVAAASQVQAASAADLAQRELERLEALRKRGVTSQAQLDAARADAAAKAAAVKVAGAQVARARAARDAARVRLGYTKIVASWRGEGEVRVVAERLVDEGATVAANTRLLSIVQLDPLLAVVSVPERDYRFLEVGLAAEVRTDAYPKAVFAAEISRIAPVFTPSSRQARVELKVPNPDHRLAPGMFAKVQLALREVQDAQVAPRSAITHRDDVAGVFEVVDGGAKVAWREVKLGIEAQEQVQILSPELVGRRVVVTGHHLLDDGARVTIPEVLEPTRR